MVTKLKRKKQRNKADCIASNINKEDVGSKAQHLSRLKFRKVQEILQKDDLIMSGNKNEFQVDESTNDAVVINLDDSLEENCDSDEKPPLPSFNELGNWHNFSCHTSDEEDGTTKAFPVHDQIENNSKIVHTNKESNDNGKIDAYSHEISKLVDHKASADTICSKRERVNSSRANDVNVTNSQPTNQHDKTTKLQNNCKGDNKLDSSKSISENASYQADMKMKPRVLNERQSRKKSVTDISSPDAKDFSISNTKRLADFERDLRLQQSRRSKNHNHDTQFNKMFKLARNDKERERILISRVSAWESSAAWHENKRIEAVRALKKHRKQLMKNEVDKVNERRHKTHEFIDIDDESNIDKTPTEDILSSRQRAKFARRALFAFAPTFQPTLTQMNFQVSDNFREDDDFEMLHKPRRVIQIEKVLQGNDSDRELDDIINFDSSSDEDINEVAELCDKQDRPSLWEASQGPIEIEDIVSAAVSKMEHEGLSQLLTLFNETPPPLQSIGDEKESSTDSSVLQSQLSQNGIENVADIEALLKANPSKFNAIQEFCPNWKEHVTYANLRTDIHGLQEALENVRESISNLKLIRDKVMDVWNKQECVLELYELALKRGISRLQRYDQDNAGNETTDIDNSVIEIIDDSEKSKYSDQHSIYEDNVSYADNDPLDSSSQESAKEDSLLDPSPFAINEDKTIAIRDNETISSKSTEQKRDVCHLVDDVSITTFLKQSKLWETFLRRETIAFEIILGTIRESGGKITKKCLIEYLDNQGIPFATSWKQKPPDK